MEPSVISPSPLLSRAHHIKLWLTIFLLSCIYSSIFSIAYIYFWPDILQLTLSLTSTGSSAGEIALKSFFILEAVIAVSVFTYVQFGTKLDFSPKIYLELLSLILALRICAGIYLGLEFFISLLSCLVVHSVIYLAAMSKKNPQKLFFQAKNP